MSRETRSYLLLLICSTIWGFAFVAQRFGAEHLGAFSFNASRGVLAVFALLPLVAWLDARNSRTREQRRQDWRDVVVPGIVLGTLFFGGQALQQIGIETTTAGNAAFVTGLYMVIVPIVGMFLGQRTTGFTWLGIALAVPGLFLLTWTGAGIAPGDLTVLLGTFFWTAHILSVARFARDLDPIRLSVAQFVVMTAISAVAALVAEPAPFAGLPLAIGSVLFAGLMSTGVGYTLQVVGQKYAKPSIAAMIMSLEAMFGAIGGALILGERLTVQGMVGAALMMVGILVAQIPSREARAKEEAGETHLIPASEAPPTAVIED